MAENGRKEQGQKEQIVEDKQGQAHKVLEEAGGNFFPSQIKSCHLLVTTVQLRV